MKEPQTWLWQLLWHGRDMSRLLQCCTHHHYHTMQQCHPEVNQIHNKKTRTTTHSANQDDLPTVHIPTHMPSRSQQQQQHAMDLSPLCAKQYSAATTGAHRKIKGFSQDEQSWTPHHPYSLTHNLMSLLTLCGNDLLGCSSAWSLLASVRSEQSSRVCADAMIVVLGSSLVFVLSSSSS